MESVIKHECGVALLRLLKPLSWYEKTYGSWMYGINKLYLLMEKQHNRGQEAAGIACVKINAAPGSEYIFRERALGTSAISEIFKNVHKEYKHISNKELSDPIFAEKYLPFAGNVYMGHLRYSTTGKSGMSYVHPFLRRSNWKNRSLLLEGNFNLTNIDELFSTLVDEGQHPRNYADTYIMLESTGHELDKKVEELSNLYCSSASNGAELNNLIDNNLNFDEILRRSSKDWDGGYVICGSTGSGVSFAFRDPVGIRTAFWYKDDDIVVVASERSVIQTAFNVDATKVIELNPGQGIIIEKDGHVSLEQIHKSSSSIKACSFERIYFSRGSDKDIYKERKTLGKNLVPTILKSIDYDLDNSVFSFIPNTAEIAFYGMWEGLDQYLNEEKAIRLQSGGNYSMGDLTAILSKRVRIEKVAIKDIKLRTFITEDKNRDDLATHVYDITYDSIIPNKDNLVVIDDSIVRGTTLKQSIIRILDRLKPKKIVIVSSSPQVRYPDCYGIDMSRLEEFIAFKAAIELLKQSNKSCVIEDVYNKCIKQRSLPKECIQNYVDEIYAPFSSEEISAQISRMLTSEDINAEVEIVYQTIDGLHKSIPNHKGDWYFTGVYPTPGGYKALNEAFINFYEGKNQRPI